MCVSTQLRTSLVLGIVGRVFFPFFPCMFYFLDTISSTFVYVWICQNFTILFLLDLQKLRVLCFWTLKLRIKKPKFPKMDLQTLVICFLISSVWVLGSSHRMVLFPRLLCAGGTWRGLPGCFF